MRKSGEEHIGWKIFILHTKVDHQSGGVNQKLKQVRKKGLDVYLTSFRGAEWGRSQACISHAGFPGETAASAPDAANPWPSLHTALLCQEGLAAGGSVNKHIVEQHAREAPEHIHGPGKENMRTECKQQGWLMVLLW